MVFLLLLLWPIAELFVLIEVAEAIGVLYTIVLLLCSWPLGSYLIRLQGRAALGRLAQAIGERRPPGREVLDGALILIGGILLMVPGFISDALGLLLLLPPTRALARGALLRNLQSRLVVRVAGFGGGARQPHDVESTASDIRPPRLDP